MPSVCSMTALIVASSIRPPVNLIRMCWPGLNSLLVILAGVYHGAGAASLAVDVECARSCSQKIQTQIAPGDS